MKKPKGGFNTILEIKNNNNMNLEDQYQNEKKQSNQLFDKCNLEAERISNIDEKIEYWNNEKTLYLKNLPKRVFDVSAITSVQNGIEIEMFFDKLVTDKINQLIQLKRSAMIPPQKTETEIEQGTPTFINNFDNIKPNEVYIHFKVGLVEKGYLTEQQLNEYLKAAFELQTKPETLFKLKHTPTKQKIYTVFYIYYKDISQKKHARQKEYAALLGDFFEGYNTEIIQTNWARDYKTKR